MLSRGITDKMVPSQATSSQDIRAQISVSDRAKSLIVASKIISGGLSTTQRHGQHWQLRNGNQGTLITHGTCSTFSFTTKGIGGVPAPECKGYPRTSGCLHRQYFTSRHGRPDCRANGTHLGWMGASLLLQATKGVTS